VGSVNISTDGPDAVGTSNAADNFELMGAIILIFLQLMKSFEKRADVNNPTFESKDEFPTETHRKMKLGPIFVVDR
jgi:hypothetical protein